MNLAAEYVDPKTLVPWSRNPRHNDEAVAGVAESIRRFGFASPILARLENREVIAGHTRLKAALSMGLDVVPVRWLDLDEEEAHALALADNKLGEAATWDDAELAAILGELEKASVPVDNLGWTTEELDAMLNPAPSDPQGDPDDVPDLSETEPESRAGEVYELGPHRLACGDSTDGEVWARLLGGRRADACVTDPPYGTSQPGVPHDSPEEHAPLMAGVLAAMLLDGVCVAFASCRTFPVWLDAVRAAGHQFHRMLWLYKQAQMGHPWRGWIMTSECALISSFGDGKWNDVHPYAHDCYTVPSVQGELPDGIGWHGSVKPVAVISDIVSRVCPPGGVVADPFGGSGTTLIACALEGRVARVIELDPRYCDVIRRRWTKWARDNGVDPGPGALD